MSEHRALTDRLTSTAAAGVGIALVAGMAQLRMQRPWSEGMLLVAIAVPAISVLGLGLAAPRRGARPAGAASALLVAGLLLAAGALLRLGHLLAGDDFLTRGGTLTWMLLAFVVTALYCARHSGSAACLLLAAVASVGLLIEAVNWTFDTSNIDVFRTLLVLGAVTLFAAGAGTPGRRGVVLVSAGGCLMVAYTSVGVPQLIQLLLPVHLDDAGWGWELIALLGGIALVAYGARENEPGPAAFGAIVLLQFAAIAALGDDAFALLEGGGVAPTLRGWPLALGIASALCAAHALRPRRH